MTVISAGRSLYKRQDRQGCKLQYWKNCETAILVTELILILTFLLHLSSQSTFRNVKLETPVTIVNCIPGPEQTTLETIWYCCLKVSIYSVRLQITVKVMTPICINRRSLKLILSPCVTLQNNVELLIFCGSLPNWNYMFSTFALNWRLPERCPKKT